MSDENCGFPHGDCALGAEFVALRERAEQAEAEVEKLRLVLLCIRDNPGIEPIALAASVLATTSASPNKSTDDP